VLRLNIFTKRKIIDQKISIFRNGFYSSEKNLSTVLILGLKFCSASIIISLPAYLTLIEANTPLYKLNFFPLQIRNYDLSLLDHDPALSFL
jgi:hypothetical protein